MPAVSRLLIWSLLFISGLLFGQSSPSEENTLPNIIIYLTDDQSRNDASIYGNALVRTPAQERLAAMGMTFTQAFVASPSCAPSRAALLTGLMPARNGAEANHSYPHDSLPVLTHFLQRLGYEVAAFGKVAHGPMNERCGFDFYSRPPVDLARRVEEFWADRTSSQPLCLLVGDRRPHVPWTEHNTYDPTGVVLPDYLLDTPATRDHWGRYYSDITGADAEMGKILDWAEATFGENFLFIFSSDHGGQWPFGKWNLYDAGINVPLVWAWPGRIEQGSRSHALVSWIDLFPTLLDLVGGAAPAGLDGRSFAPVLLGAQEQHRPVIYTTHSGDGVMNVYPIRSLRTERYKYILNLLPDAYHTNHSDILRKDRAGAYWNSWEELAETDESAAAVIQKYHVRPAEELYDLQSDPTEQRNLAGQPEYQEQLIDFRNQLQKWMDSQGDQQTVFRKPYPVSSPLPDADAVERNRQ